MPADTQALIEKIRALPEERVAEVEDFVDFLAGKTSRAEALDRLLAIVPALEAAGAPAVTEEQVRAEVKAVRAPRHGRVSDADRS
jgi:hypothetical protein